MALIAFGISLQATSANTTPTRVEDLTVELIAASDSIQPAIPFEVGLRMVHDPGWHTYWTNMGDTVGQAPAIDWKLPPGFTAGPLRLAYPQTFDSFGDVGLGFEGEVTHLVTITPPADLAIGSQVTLEADVNWLACEEICVPGEANLALTLTVSEDPGVPGSNAAAITQADLDQPATAEGWTLTVDSEDGNIIYRITPTSTFEPDLSSLFLAPETASLSALTPPETFDWDGVTLTVTAAPHRENPDESVPDRVRAVLTSSSGFGAGIPGNAILLDTNPQAKNAAVSSDDGTPALASPDAEEATGGLPFGGGLLGALIGGFLGGLILNIMPCVFPVISLKIMSFVTHAGESRRKLLNHGLLFTAGILVFFWVLVAFLLGIKALTGQEQGWAAQFQYPVFNMIMAIVMIILALSLFGVFEFGTSLAGVGGNLTSGTGYGASFWSGALATLLATPCTGPFLGAAVSFALGQPAGVTLLFFTIMGLGMASPYILLSAAPALLKFIPRPGPWMESFKQFMGFPMLITAIWLLWVLEAQIGPTGIMFFSFALVAIAIAAWCLGRFATPVTPKRKRLIGRIAALVFVLAAIQLSVSAKSHTPTETSVRDEPVAQTVADLRASGKNVFVDFTARWCQICQKNKTVIHSEEVEAALKEHDVEFLIVDWTNKDPETLAYLQTFGRSGVPFYPLFPADPEAPPIILPQYLTVNEFKRALEQLP
ncbi:MAG: protein-disulfide reductase DsbD domain-containing protein [Verrucomicrobiota bacterium]